MNRYLPLDNETHLSALQKDSADRLYALVPNGSIFTINERGQLLKVSRKEFAKIFELDAETLTKVLRSRGKSEMVVSNAAVEPARALLEDGVSTDEVDTKTVPNSLMSGKLVDKKAKVAEDTEVIAGEVGHEVNKANNPIDKKEMDKTLVIEAKSISSLEGNSTAALKANPEKSVRKQMRELRARVEALEADNENLREVLDRLVDMLLKKNQI